MSMSVKMGIFTRKIPTEAGKRAAMGVGRAPRTFLRKGPILPEAICLVPTPSLRLVPTPSLQLVPTPSLRTDRQPRHLIPEETAVATRIVSRRLLSSTVIPTRAHSPVAGSAEAPEVEVDVSVANSRIRIHPAGRKRRGVYVTANCSGAPPLQSRKPLPRLRSKATAHRVG